MRKYEGPVTLTSWPGHFTLRVVEPGRRFRVTIEEVGETPEAQITSYAEGPVYATFIIASLDMPAQQIGQNIVLGVTWLTS